MRRAILVMGVSGCGKTVVGRALAGRLGGRFLDGDDYHPAGNVARMAAGQPLTDAMRRPWLDRLAEAVVEARQEGSVVFACSALKRSYRARLEAGIAGLRTIWLDVPREVVLRRVATRPDHFMPASLVDSQFATLEPPSNAIRLDAAQPVEAVVAQALKAL